MHAKETADTTTKIAETVCIRTRRRFKIRGSGCSRWNARSRIGKLALEKSTNVNVKEFATMIVSDHEKVNTKLIILAGTKT